MTKEVKFNSLLKDKIEIMQAALDGKQIQAREGDVKWRDVLNDLNHIKWLWEDTQYRIKPREPLEFYVAIQKGDTENVTLIGCSFSKTERYQTDVIIIKVREILDDVSPNTEEG